MRGTTPGRLTLGERPSLGLQAALLGMRAYSTVFAQSRLAPTLSRRRPVRRTGFELNLRVEEIRTAADEVISLSLARPGGGELPTWTPGCHLDVFLPSGRQRQYSLCGDPGDRSHYRIAVRRIADGAGGSIELYILVSEGDLLTVRGPRNAFPYVAAESHLFIAAGIGITPILPMVRAASRSGARWDLVYLGRSERSMPFLDELEGLRGGTVGVRPDDTHGRPDVTQILAQAEPGAVVHLCGPPPLLEAARTLMPEINPKGSLHIERFSAPPVAGGAPFVLELARSKRTIEVAGEETALAAIRRELPDVRYSCQQGYCGTCKVGVLKGTVDHRDSALMERERADTMMICVSRACDDRLTIDL